jgi:hypothetical protein
MMFMSRLDPKDRKKVLIAAAIPLLLGIALLIFVRNSSSKPVGKTLELPERNDTVPTVPIMANYGTKIVYTTDVTTDKTDYIGDCKTRGGTFNACGTTCKPGAEMCATMCAFTCEVK